MSGTSWYKKPDVLGWVIFWALIGSVGACCFGAGFLTAALGGMFR